jgi:hypothetical protein
MGAQAIVEKSFHHEETKSTVRESRNQSDTDISPRRREGHEGFLDQSSNFVLFVSFVVDTN